MAKRTEWAVQWLPYDADEFREVRGFQTKREADRWVRGEALLELSDELHVYKVAAKKRKKR
jgi:hypothetical protein